MARLAVLEPDARVFARLAAALGDQHELIECRDLCQLWDVVDGPVEGCVVDIYHPSAPLSLNDLQRLRRRMPPLAIVVYADFEDHELDLFELGRLKVDSVLLDGATDRPEETRRAVGDALAAASALGVMVALAGRLHPLAMECLRWAIERADDSPTVDQLAEAIGLSKGVLARELRHRRLPPAARLLLWGRLFCAARMLSGPERSVEVVAYRLGYSSASALARALQRETGLAPTELRAEGAVTSVLDAFLRREVRAGGALV